MSEYPNNSTAKVYSDSDGNEVTLRQLVRTEPDWAISRIKVSEGYQSRITELENALLEAADNFILIKMAPFTEHQKCADKYRAIAKGEK